MSPGLKREGLRRSRSARVTNGRVTYYAGRENATIRNRLYSNDYFNLLDWKKISNMDSSLGLQPWQINKMSHGWTAVRTVLWKKSITTLMLRNAFVLSYRTGCRTSLTLTQHTQGWLISPMCARSCSNRNKWIHRGPLSMKISILHGTMSLCCVLTLTVAGVD